MDEATRLLWLSYGPDAMVRHLGPDGALAACGVRPSGLPADGWGCLAPPAPAGAPSLGDDNGKPPWAVPNTERPANPFALASIALGRPATSVGDVERAFGLGIAQVLAPGGPLFNPDLSKLPGAVQRPAGAPSAPSPLAAPLGNGVVRLAKLSSIAGPAFDASKLAAAIDRSAPPPTAPLYTPSRPADPVPNFRDLRDPALILARLNLTAAQWASKTCFEQIDALFNRQLDDRGVPASRLAVWEQWGAVNRAVAPRGVDRAGGEFYWVRRGTYLSGAPSVLDPVQGVVGNCFYIASLAGAAWVKPEVIRAANWRGGGDEARRPGSVNFYQPGRASLDAPVSFTDTTPQNLLLAPSADGDYMTNCHAPFCSPYSFGRCWGQAYEKAMAAWRTGRPDTPEMGAFTSYYVDEATHPALNIAGGLGTSALMLWRGLDVTWRFVTDHCELTASGDRKAGAVLIATSSGSPPGANVAPRHCYTVLGYRLVAGSLAQQKVVLRNPWGRLPPGDPRDNVGTWMGLALGEGGVGVMNLEPFYNSFNSITGNWYGARHEYDFGTDARWTDFSR